MQQQQPIGLADLLRMLGSPIPGIQSSGPSMALPQPTPPPQPVQAPPISMGGSQPASGASDPTAGQQQGQGGIGGMFSNWSQPTGSGLSMANAPPAPLAGMGNMLMRIMPNLFQTSR